MSDQTTSAHVREVAPGVCIIDVAGDVTAASEAVLVGAYEESVGRGAAALVLGFDGLAYMNSGGIGLLVMLLVRAQRADQGVFAFGLSEHYRQILELTRLDEAMGIHDSEAAALAAVGDTAGP